MAMAMAPEPEPEPAADKLQKEREMMQKKEKKEEKKRQKKAAQLGEKRERSDHHHSKHGHKKRKHEGQNIVAPEMRKDLKDTMEQLEKSGISEEHEAPSCSQALDAESSLNSNKRLRATVSASPSQPRNGVFRVKLAPTKQRRYPESTVLLAAKPIVLEKQPVNQTGLDLSMAKGESYFQPHINTVTVVKQLVAPEQKMAIRNGNQPCESRQVNQQQPAMVMQRVNMVPRASPQQTPKVMQRVDPRPTKVLQRVEPAPVKVMQRAGQSMPSKVFHRDNPQVPANMLKKPTAVAAPLGQLNVKPPSMPQKPKTCAKPPVVKHQQQMDALHKDELCSVRTIIAAAPEQKMSLRNGNQLGESRQVNQQQPAMVMKRVNMLPRDSPQPTLLQRVDPPSRKVLQRADLARANVMQRPDDLMPPKVFGRETPQVPANVLKTTTAAPLGRPSVEKPALLHRPKVSVEAPVVKPQQQMDALPKNDPRSVRTTIAEAPAKEVKQPSSDRKNHKAEKKEREFADLFVTWKPSTIQIEEDMDVDDQNWLFSCGATPRSNCRAFDGSARCQPNEQLFSLQPRAVHLPDLHMYQLPYVVPF